MTDTAQHPTPVRRVNMPTGTKPGTRPGTITVDPNAPAPVIRVTTYGPDAVDEHAVESVEDLPQYLNQRAVTWINVDGLGDAATLQRLGELFSVHPLALEDIAHVHQRAKVEEYDDQVFIVVRMVHDGAGKTTEQVSMILGEGFVLSFQERAGDCLDPVRKRIRKPGSRLRESKSDFLAYALIDAIIDAYFPVLERYGERIEHLETQLFDRATRETITLIHQLRSELYMLRKAIWPHREAMNALMRDTVPLITPFTRVFLRDCYDHAVQIIDITETCREMCGDLRDFHFSQISMRQNEIMKVLTITATLFIPLGFIAGVYGMNFDPGASPLNMPELSWYYGYPFALTLMGTVTAGMLGLFWYRGWIGRRRKWHRPRAWLRLIKHFSKGDEGKQ